MPAAFSESCLSGGVPCPLPPATIPECRSLPLGPVMLSPALQQEQEDHAIEGLAQCICFAMG
ncbi:unnamed protein product [Eretmochelys imbricata]